MEDNILRMATVVYLGFCILELESSRTAGLRRRRIIESGRTRRQAIRRSAARRRRTLLRRTVALLSTDGETLARYGRINQNVPILTKFFEDDQDLQPDFRLSRRAIHMLIGMLPGTMDHGWGYMISVLVFVYWLACGTSYRVVSEVFAIPRSTVHRMVHAIADDVMVLLPKVIHLPDGEDLDATGEGFCELAGHSAFRKVVGAIDGCHIRIKPPGGAIRQCYINRKLFPSIIMQAVCGPSGKFFDVFVGYPGSVHDSRVLRNSPIYTQHLYPPHGCVLLGDGGYPCLEDPIRIITPYREPVHGPVETRFNRHHAKARSIIERAFGLMKSRWRSIFYSALEVHSTFAPKVAAACAVLHNICLGAEDILEEDSQPPENDPDPVAVLTQETPGLHLRQRMAEEVSAPERFPAGLQDHCYFQCVTF